MVPFVSVGSVRTAETAPVSQNKRGSDIDRMLKRLISDPKSMFQPTFGGQPLLIFQHFLFQPLIFPTLIKRTLRNEHDTDWNPRDSMKKQCAALKDRVLGRMATVSQANICGYYRCCGWRQPVA